MNRPLVDSMLEAQWEQTYDALAEEHADQDKLGAPLDLETLAVVAALLVQTYHVRLIARVIVEGQA